MLSLFTLILLFRFRQSSTTTSITVPAEFL